MYRGFKLTLADDVIKNINENYSTDSVIKECYDLGLKSFSNYKKTIRKNLKEYLVDSTQLDGSRMQEDWFPQVSADIFLSHSHINEPAAIFLAGLFDSFGLSTFIDSCVWGYSNDLLKMIDNKYSISEDDPSYYDYNKRNQSTSHIHMMLNTALMNMIDKCECLILLNTPDSIKVSDIKNKTETLSPWIYSELSISKLINKNIPKRRNEERIVNLMEDGGRVIQKAFSAESMIDVKYKVDLNHLVNIYLDKWFTYVENNNIDHDIRVLDALYDTHPLPKRSIITG